MTQEILAEIRDLVRRLVELEEAKQNKKSKLDEAIELIKTSNFERIPKASAVSLIYPKIYKKRWLAKNAIIYMCQMGLLISEGDCVTKNHNFSGIENLNTKNIQPNQQ